MVTFLVLSVAAVLVLLVGVWLSPVIRAGYGYFRSAVESKLKLNEQKAKDKALHVINKL